MSDISVEWLVEAMNQLADTDRLIISTHRVLGTDRFRQEAGPYRDLADKLVREYDRVVAAQPMYLACGCLAGTHDNTNEALHEAHPEVVGWDYSGPFYGGAAAERMDEVMGCVLDEAVRKR